MTINHRKLISDTVVINVTAFCEPFCDPRNNISGYCPDICFYDCPSCCITPYVPPPHHHSSSRKTLHQSLIITLSFVGLVCLFYCLFTLYKHYKGRTPLQVPQGEVRDQDEFLDEEQGPILDHPIWYIRTVGLQPSVIDLITVCKYKRGEGLVEGTDCSVCLSEFEDDETLRLLPKCNHAFHLSCIDTWLRSHTNCPLCRAPIVSIPNGTLSPILEQSFDGSVAGEENRVVASEESQELERGVENRDSGSSQGWRKISDSVETNMVQSMRRSVSMDSLAASRLNSAIANAQLEELNEVNGGNAAKRLNFNQGLVAGSSTFKRSSQKGLLLMKRSASCSGKVLFSRHNREMNSALPL